MAIPNAHAALQAAFAATAHVSEGVERQSHGEEYPTYQLSADCLRTAKAWNLAAVALAQIVDPKVKR